MTSPVDTHALIAVLKARFETHPARHPGLPWAEIQARLEARPAKLAALSMMEASGGEPDVVAQDPATGEFLFVDCAAQSPAGRRSCCYDREGLESRKEHRPAACATELAAEMGVELLDEAQYRALQALGEFDTRTSSWLRTPEAMRRQGGALFGDRRYGQVFIYHNGAQSYYGVRGFRGVLKV